MFGLEEKEIELIRNCLASYGEIQEVKVFGSRAEGYERHNSDIDLVYWGSLSSSEHIRLYGDLDELPLPYQFDLKNYAAIKHQVLKEHIQRVARTLYMRDKRL